MRKFCSLRDLHLGVRSCLSSNHSFWKPISLTPDNLVVVVPHPDKLSKNELCQQYFQLRNKSKHNDILKYRGPNAGPGVISWGPWNAFIYLPFFN